MPLENLEDVLKRFQRHADLDKLNAILPHIRKLQRLASQHGIHDIFQDNGGKLLQLLLVTGLTAIPGREGNGARDTKGKEYEVKTVNRFDTKGNHKSNPQFTTHHHLNTAILAKYWKVDWQFAAYSGIELEAVYFMAAEMLEPYFSKWEQDYARKAKELNNPKIDIKFVEKSGIQIFKNPAPSKPRYM